MPVEGFFGLVDPNDPNVSRVDTTDTVLNPQHAVWNQDDKPDEWVLTETDARRKINQSIQELMTPGAVKIKEIHKLLVEKMNQIESDLGMRSDVLGQVLEEVDLDQTIMTAIGEDRSQDEVIADIEQTVEERRQALETVENELLIRDRFDLSDEDEEILDVIDRSQHGDVSEDDIEILIREFFDEFGGDIRGVRPGPARSEGDVFQLEVPNLLSGGQVSGQYEQATFSRKVAREQDDVAFIALDHPLVQSVIDFYLESDRLHGDITVRVAADEDPTPGICFTYRLGYVSGAGDTVTEKLPRLYVTSDREVTKGNPKYTDMLSASEANQLQELDQLATIAEELHSVAQMRAWDEVESFAEEAREERAWEVTIK